MDNINLTAGQLDATGRIAANLRFACIAEYGANYGDKYNSNETLRNPGQYFPQLIPVAERNPRFYRRIQELMQCVPELPVALSSQELQTARDGYNSERSSLRKKYFSTPVSEDAIKAVKDMISYLADNGTRYKLSGNLPEYEEHLEKITELKIDLVKIQGLPVGSYPVSALTGKP